MKDLPVKITPCPVVDAIVDIRFESDFFGDAIFGMLYGRLKNTYPKVDPMPILQLPKQMIDADPSFKFQPQYKLSNDKVALHIGGQVIAFSDLMSGGSYLGWREFSNVIKEALQAINELGIVKKALRVGVRYVDFFESDIFEHIKLNVVTGKDLETTGKKLVRFEMLEKETGAMCAVQVSNHTRVVNPQRGIDKEGAVIDIDAYFENISTSKVSLEDLVENGHLAQKKLFFNLLTPDFLASLSPEYDQ